MSSSLASSRTAAVRRALRLFWELVLRDLRDGFLGSYLSVAWAFLQPAITVLLLWFVFQVGFKAGPQNDRPFILWLLTGMIPWFFLSEAWAGATNSVIGHRYLVKNVVFPLGVLPLVKIGAALLVHLFFIGVIVAILVGYGIPLHWSLLQIPYYTFASLVLLMGLSWLTSSLMVFVKDTVYIVSTLIQFGFWFTPIMWNVSMIPGKYKLLVLLNPFYYLIEGYRHTFLYNEWFWAGPRLTLYFWCFALGTFVLGRLVFIKLRPHFADII